MTIMTVYDRVCTLRSGYLSFYRRGVSSIDSEGIFKNYAFALNYEFFQRNKLH